jgi:hypothetical protein
MGLQRRRRRTSKLAWLSKDCENMKGYCDRCEHPRKRNLYKTDYGDYVCTQCYDRLEREHQKEMKAIYKDRMETTGLDYVVLYPDETW